MHRVRAGETLEQHRAPPRHAGRARWRASTTWTPATRSVEGQRLVIKASARRYRDEGAPAARRVLYTVRRGDTVYSIARQFQVSVAQLKSWNGLNKRHQIRAGQRLVMYVDPHRTQG